MQTGPAGIGEHIQHIILGLCAFIGHAVHFLFGPPLLPFFFNIPEIVFHCERSSFYLMNEKSPSPGFNKNPIIWMAIGKRASRLNEPKANLWGGKNTECTL
jgi:hypothetical protein